MKTLQFSRTLALTGLALTPMAWLISGCGGGGGGSNSNNGTPRPTNTPRPTATTRPTTTATTSPSATATVTATATATTTSVPTRTPTPIPTPLATNGNRILANIDLGGGQIGILNLVNRGLNLTGLITAAPIPADKVGVFLVQPGTYAVTGSVTFSRSFQFGGSLLLVNGSQIPFRAAGQLGTPNTITVTVGNTTFPPQNF